MLYHKAKPNKAQNRIVTQPQKGRPTTAREARPTPHPCGGPVVSAWGRLAASAFGTGLGLAVWIGAVGALLLADGPAEPPNLQRGQVHYRGDPRAIWRRREAVCRRRLRVPQTDGSGGRGMRGLHLLRPAPIALSGGPIEKRKHARPRSRRVGTISGRASGVLPINRTSLSPFV